MTELEVRARIEEAVQKERQEIISLLDKVKSELPYSDTYTERELVIADLTALVMGRMIRVE